MMRLEEVCSHVVDCKNRTAPIDPRGEFFAVGTPAMRGNVINWDEARRINAETFGEWTKRLLPKSGDILFAREAPVGPVVAIPEGGNIAAGQRTVLLRPDPLRTDSIYLRMYLSAPITQARIAALSHGSTTPHLRVADVRSFSVTLPPLGEQRAIAEVLGALDDKIAANTKVASTAMDIASHIFDASTANLLTIPMSKVLSPILGGTPPRAREDYWSGTELWASAKDITGAPFNMVVDTLEQISSSAIVQTKAKPLPRGSVILTARGTVGAVARLSRPASFNQSCYGFKPGNIPPGVLYFSIVKATERAKAIAHGSVFDTITMRTFDHLEFPEFHGNQMSEVELRVEPLLETVESAVLENRALAATRDTLLPQLMSGKLRVKEAEALVEELV